MLSGFPSVSWQAERARIRAGGDGKPLSAFVLDWWRRLEGGMLCESWPSGSGDRQLKVAHGTTGTTTVQSRCSVLGSRLTL